MRVNTDIHSYLLSRLGNDPTKSVLEIGAGRGTISLSKLFAVTAIEHDEKYLNLTDEAEYLHIPLMPYSDPYFRHATFWYDRQTLKKALGDCEFDAIIVDGPKGDQGRGGFFTNLDLFRSPIYIFDDVHRTWEFRLAGKVANHFGVPFETYTNYNQWFSVVEPRKPVSSWQWDGKRYGR
jgi:hypothetical protein